MKKSSLALVLTLCALVIPCAYAADDLCAVGPTHCKILKEDAKVRVIDYTAKAGDKVGMHTHPAHVIYVIKGGRTKFTLPDGSTTERNLKAGEAVINPAVTHATENVTAIHVIIVEMKQ